MVNKYEDSICSQLALILRRLDELETKITESSVTSKESREMLTGFGNALIAEIKKAEPPSQIFAEDRDRDILELLLSGRFSKQVAQVITDHPVAVNSDDHKYPLGTKYDNTRHPRFVRACEAIIGHKISHLDLGCSGGGLVWDFLRSGHFSIGIEGSDFSLLNCRAEWRTIPNNLFTADITKPFKVYSADGSTPLQFDLVTAWEVLEHISEFDLPEMFANIRLALLPGGLFVASVATFEDRDPQTGAVWHVTIKPKDWWHRQVQEAGFYLVDDLFRVGDFPRGTGSPRAPDWDVRVSPHLGFHLVCRAP